MKWQKSIQAIFIPDRETHIRLASLLILLWSYTALDKIISHQQFIQALQRQFFHESFITPLSILIPVAELLITIMLLNNKWRKVGFISSSILLSIFTIYVALAAFGMLEKMPCACGGIISSLSWGGHLLINITFLGLALTGSYLYKNEKGGAVTRN